MNSEFKHLIKPISLLLFLLFLSIFVFKIGFNQINLIIAKTNESKETQRLLTSKVRILETVDEAIASDISHVDFALPSRGSALYGLSQIKKQARSNTIIITNLKAGVINQGESGVSKTSLSFDAQGEYDNVYSFLNSFNKVLPLMSLEKVKIDKTDNITHAAVTVFVYSADLPEKIPSIEESVDGFSEDEVNTLRLISGYELPEFFEPTPNESEARLNPFE